MRHLLIVFMLLLLCPVYSLHAQEGRGEEEHELLGMTDKIEKRIAKIRGLEFIESVHKGYYTQAELRTRLLAEFDDDFPEEEIRGWEAALKLFNLIPRDYDLRQSLLDMLTGQIAGFYNPEKKELFLIDMNLLYLEHSTLAHEIFHSLQDQYVDLEQFTEVVDFNDDLSLARTAVIEGEAEAVQARYEWDHALELLRQEREADPLDESMLGLSVYATQRNTPFFIQFIFDFPYTCGMEFAELVLEEHGWGMMDILYRVPPRSTEQILHPEKFFDERDDPVRISLEKVTARLAPDFTLQYENSMGEYQILALLQVAADPTRAGEAAAGWDGDTYGVYQQVSKSSERSAGCKILLWALTFDSDEDAAQFFKEESRALSRKYKALGGGLDEKIKIAFQDEGLLYHAPGASQALLERRGPDLILLDGIPSASATLLHDFHEAAWLFTKAPFDFKSLRPVPISK